MKKIYKKSKKFRILKEFNNKCRINWYKVQIPDTCSNDGQNFRMEVSNG